MLSHQGIPYLHPHHTGCNQTGPPPHPPSASAGRTPAQKTGVGTAVGMPAGTETIPAAGTGPQSSTTPASMPLQTGARLMLQLPMETDRYAAAGMMIEPLWTPAMATGTGPGMLTGLLMGTGTVLGGQIGGPMGSEGIRGLAMREAVGMRSDAADQETRPGAALAQLTGNNLLPSCCGQYHAGWFCSEKLPVCPLFSRCTHLMQPAPVTTLLLSANCTEAGWLNLLHAD